MFASHPLLRPEAVEEREYQRVLASRVIEAPHLLVLPTGLGKTVIALRALLHFLQSEPTKRVLVLAPTKPLADQHARFFRTALNDVPVACFTGETTPQDRDTAWARHRVIVATPQVVQNDVVRGTRDLSDISFVVFDEAHRASGNYPYSFLARRYHAAGGRHALGLTASPGNSGTTVHRILAELGLERIEVRTESDPDVMPYLHRIETQWVRVRPTPSMLRLVKLLERCYARCILALRRLGYFQLLKGLPSRRDLIELGHRLRAEATGTRSHRGVYEAVSLQARALKIQHALELAETQGSALVHRFLQRVEQEATRPGGSKAARDILREPEFSEALVLACDDASVAPKVARAGELIQTLLTEGARRILLFANYRETAELLVEHLSSRPSIRASRFVGHANAQGEKGMTKRDQQNILEQFRSGQYNVLVATAVGEEGLDLPETDAVVFHEPVPSLLRTIQRRGRTGRSGDGRVFVLITEGTRDETYQWSSVRRERRLHAELLGLRRLMASNPAPIGPRPPRPAPPAAAPPSGLEVTMDPREAPSPVAKALVERGVLVKSVPLPTGDYAVGESVLVERKTAEDLAASLRDGRLLDQLARLSNAGRGVLLVEGDPFRAATGISPAAIHGALAAAVLDHGVSVLLVPDAHGTVEFLLGLARRQQRGGDARPLRVEKPGRGADAQMRFVLEGIPGVGPVLARRLLEAFGSVAGVCAASDETLRAVPGVGTETARSIRDTLHRPVTGGEVRASALEAQLPESALEAGDGAAR